MIAAIERDLETLERHVSGALAAVRSLRARGATVVVRELRVNGALAAIRSLRVYVRSERGKVGGS